MGGRRLPGPGSDWVENVLGLSVEVVHRTPKPIPEKIARIWAEEWAKEGKRIDWQRLVPRRSFEVLPRRWGCGAYVRLVVPQPSDEDGLRAAVRDERSVHLCSDDSPYGEAVGPC